MMPVALMMLLSAAPVAQTVPATTEDAIDWDDYAPCGAVSLYLACRMQEKSVTWNEIKTLVGAPRPGGELNFENLAHAASQLGMNPIGLEVGRADLQRLPMPAIVQVHDARYPDELPHFLVLLRPEADGVWLLDAPFAAYFLPEERFQQSWTGKILVFAENETEVEQLRTLARRSLNLRWLAWGLVITGAMLFSVPALIRWWRRRLPFGAGLPAGDTNEGLRQTRPRSLGKSTVWVGGIALLLTLGIVSFVFYSRMHRGQEVPPRCDFGQQVLELGELAPGTHSIRVRIKNDGSQPLRITQASSNCSCCALVQTPDGIEPGQSTALDVELRVIPGPTSIRVTVESNDPQGPKHLIISWQGKAQPRLSPRWVAASDVPLDRPYERTVRLLYPGGKSALIPSFESYECDQPGVEIRAGRNNPSAHKFINSGLVTNLLGELELHLRVQPPAAAGYFHAVCKLSLSYGESTQTVVLPLLLTFNGGQLAPDVNFVTFSATSRDELLSQERLVRVEDQDPHGEITVVDVPPWLRCDIQKKSGKEHLVQLKLLSLPSIPITQHKLTITRKAGNSLRFPPCVNVIRP